MVDLFNIILVNPIVNVLVAIYQGLLALGVPYPLGFSIIGLTVFIRLLLYPFITSQLRASKKMQEVAPHLSRIKEKHKGDTKRIHQETMNLYKQHGVNPAAGCLPVLIQLPVIWALYSVFQMVVNTNAQSLVSEINKRIYVGQLELRAAWSPEFFGIPLGKNPMELVSFMPLILLVPLITGALQLIQTKMLFAKPAPTSSPQKREEDFATMFQKQSLYLFPFMIGFFSFTFPIGLSLYWNTFTLFGILQQYQVLGLGGLSEWLKAKKQLSKK